MPRNLRAAFLAITSAAFVALTAAPALAGAPSSASGNGTVAFIPTGFRTAGGNTVVSASLDGTIGGTLTGTWSEQATEVFHPDGTATTQAFGTFIVATSCGTGSFDFELEAQQASPTSPVAGVFRSIDDSAATLTIHTVDTFASPANSTTFAYSGIYSC